MEDSSKKDSPKKDSDDTARASPLVKSITTATLLLYALGWGGALAWQSGWETSMRASYGYQLGWGTCLVACAAALFLRRGHDAHKSAAIEPRTAATSISEESV